MSNFFQLMTNFLWRDSNPEHLALIAYALPIKLTGQHSHQHNVHSENNLVMNLGKLKKLLNNRPYSLQRGPVGEIVLDGMSSR